MLDFSSTPYVAMFQCTNTKADVVGRGHVLKTPLGRAWESYSGRIGYGSGYVWQKYLAKLQMSDIKV